jgi:amidase
MHISHFIHVLFLYLLQIHVVQCFLALEPKQLAGFRKDVSVPLPDLYEASVLELQEGLDAGHFTSVDLIKASLFDTDLSFIPALNFLTGVFCSH